MDSPNDVTATTTRDSMHSMDKPLEKTPGVTSSAHHALAANDPENPQNWPLYRKVYACATATAFASAV
jgi:hypothetical protein